MSFCPQCRYEYQAEVLVCPDCNEALVDQLQPQSPVAMVPDESWVVMGKVSSQMKTELAKGSLDSNNIPSVILSTSFNAYGKGMDFQSGLLNSSSEMNVIMVPREFQDDAEVVLGAVLGDDLIRVED